MYTTPEPTNENPFPKPCKKSKKNYFWKTKLSNKRTKNTLKSNTNTSLQSLDRKLWRLFSWYIRIRDSYGFFGSQTMCRCITCSKVKNVNDGDAGHFIQRRKKATRYYEKNVNFQCTSCNRFNQGEQYKYAKSIDRKYGNGTSETIYNLSELKTKLDRLWYLSMIDEITTKLKSFGITDFKKSPFTD